MNRKLLTDAKSEDVRGTGSLVQAIVSLGVILGLAASASARDVPAFASASPSPLQAQKAQKPRRHWYEIGVASWYGQQFQGRKTATGERYDMNRMTCAHPTLPLGTWLKVTNLKSRRTAFVRVNDRGPLFEGRIVDLSFAAAHAVGLTGLGKVKLETVPATDPALAADLMAHVQFPAIFDTLRR